MKDDRPLIPPPGSDSYQVRRQQPSTTPSVFTAFVRSQQGEETPDAELLHDAWSGLQTALGGELKRRGLWHSPPCYLGVYGYDRWDAEDTVGDPMSQAWCHTRAPQSALAELVTDCWAYIFSERMRGLKQQLADKENIDGLVLRNVKNFLYERQREHDPVGFRIFERLKEALADAVSRQILYVLGGDPRIRNHTVLGFEAAKVFRVSALDLGPIVSRWNDELLPGLVTSRGRQEAAILVRLEELLLKLPQQGISCFRFKDLVDPLKNDARQRWAAFLAREDSARTGRTLPDHVQPHPQVLPDCSIEAQQSFEYLIYYVSESIRCLEIDARTRGYLGALWSFLQLQSMEVNPEKAGGSERSRIETEEGPLSHRELSQRLHIPRERMPMLFAILKQIISHRQLAGRAQIHPRRVSEISFRRSRE